MESKVELWLIRHGETEWSLSGAHTGITDIPLTERGEERAAEVEHYLHHRPFQLVLVSPRKRAQETCRIAGYGDQAVIDDNLSEWNYGVFEGRTTAEIQKEIPEWSVWTGPLPQGETVDQVGARADKVIARSVAANGPVALFAHGHILRILAARWLGLAADAGALFALGTGSVSVLGFERETHVIRSWNRSFEEEA